MLILSLNSAGPAWGVCVWRDGAVLAEVEEYLERGQDQRLLPLVIETMDNADVRFNQLDRIAVVRGPGSFTGLRIGLAAAHGLALAADTPILGVDRFTLYRSLFDQKDKNLLVIIHSKRKELFCQLYPIECALPAPVMMDLDEIRHYLTHNPNTVVAGDVRITDWAWQGPPGVKECVQCAVLAAAADPDNVAFAPTPLYIRPPDVTLKKNEITLEPVTPDMSDALVAIHAKGFGKDAWSHAQMLGSLSLVTTHGWAALDKNVLVGFVLLQTMQDEQEILTFSVSPDHHRRTIGKTLLRKVIDDARASCVKRIFLDVAADNRAAITLYEQAGFALAGKRANYYKHSNKSVDGLIFKFNVSGD
jgi:tRNA threonylcarbamoyladenosine biosynthesis protein TsaB